MRAGRLRVALVALLVLAGVVGCASVPESSPVQVLRQIGEADNELPPGPVEGSNALDLVRDFIFASGDDTDRHRSARRFLAPEAESWNDSADLTVLDEKFDTVPAPGPQDADADTRMIRIRGVALGRLTRSGAFEPEQATFERVVKVVRREGQWRISALPDGVVVPLPTFRDNYRLARTWFVDPVRRLAVPDLRYVPSAPAKAQAARAMELLLAGPSGALIGAAVSQLPAEARLRSNVAVAPGSDGALTVDLTDVGELDEPSRRLLAAQVVLTLEGVNVSRVRLLVDGEPLVAGRPVLVPNDVADLSARVRRTADVPGLVVYGGRLRNLTGPEPSALLPGPAGNGEYDVESAATTFDGQRLAVVAREGTKRSLLVGGGAGGGIAPVALTATTMSRPSWAPTGSEVWTVLDSKTIARVLVDPAGPARTEQVDAADLAARGPIRDLRLSPDGMRVVAVVGGRVYTAAVARSIDGEVAVRNIRYVRMLRPADLGEVMAADWRTTDSDSVVAVTRGSETLVAEASVDGLSWRQVPGNNLTPPLTAVAGSSSRPILVTDQTGVWSFAAGDQAAWRQVLGGIPDAVPVYPG